MQEQYLYRVYVQRPGVTGHVWRDVTVVSTSDRRAAAVAKKLTLQQFPAGYTASARLTGIKSAAHV